MLSLTARWQLARTSTDLVSGAELGFDALCRVSNIIGVEAVPHVAAPRGLLSYRYTAQELTEKVSTDGKP